MRRIELDDIAMFYRQDGAGAPVLLVHGLGSSGEDWEAQIPALAARYKVITPDLRDHGSSSKPAGKSSVRVLAADLLALVRRLGLAPVHVVGVSLGGMIAFQMAVDAPELVASLTIVNSGPDMRLRKARERTAILARFATLRLFGFGKLAEDLAERLFPKEEQAELRARFVARWLKNDAAAYERTLRGMVGWSVQTELGCITCPVHVVTGDRDYTPVEHKRSYVSALADARLTVIEDSGHMTPFDQPERLNEVLLAFLDEVAPRVASGARTAIEPRAAAASVQLPTSATRPLAVAKGST